MRANRTYGSEGGESQALPDPYHVLKQTQDVDGRVKPGHDAAEDYAGLRRATSVAVGGAAAAGTAWTCDT
jgi:hypothetical protein